MEFYTDIRLQWQVEELAKQELLAALPSNSVIHLEHLTPTCARWKSGPRSGYVWSMSGRVSEYTKSGYIGIGSESLLDELYKLAP